MTSNFNIKSNTSCTNPKPNQCPNCGSENVVVKETEQYPQNENGICGCDCGACEDGVAAEKESINHCREIRWGWLVDNPNSTTWEESEFEIVEEEMVDLTIYCEECYDHSSHDDWYFERIEINPDDIELDRAISCRDCGLEFDFKSEDFE
ncbi:MAG: hypothetical protein HN745_12875 [Deltaproteobacteria bacterium]|jgi:hypothetical protein|nr:hypothetical protein [Deltaproteobacteria bacterium]MBT7712613.1 hypothetical protein [Deltaproteobacteria bacterium]